MNLDFGDIVLFIDKVWFVIAIDDDTQECDLIGKDGRIWYKINIKDVQKLASTDFEQQLNTDVLKPTDIKRQLESLEKSTQAVQQQSISNRNKIRELDHMLQELDTILYIWMTITDNRYKEQQKNLNGLNFMI